MAELLVADCAFCIAQVSLVTAQVREVAEKAQVDLGLDYAWLDEVTYSDWQRYHSLIDSGSHIRPIA
jgi:hypothetical protein